MKRKVCFILAVLMFAQLYSCASGTADDSFDSDLSDTSGNPNGTTAAETDGGFIDRLSVDDEIGDYDFGGENFDIVLSTKQMSDPYFTEAENGETINDAVYKRTLTVEDRFNVKLVHHDTGGDWNEVAEAVRMSVLAGDGAYDLAVAHTFIGLTGLMSSGALYDWNKLPVVDMTKPWWNASAKEKLEIDGILLTACSDYVYQRPMVLYFNKQMVKDYALEDPYELVTSGKWTWDKLTEQARAVSADLNGDGIYDKSDQYGFSMTIDWQSITAVHSAGMSLASFDSNGYPKFDSYLTDKMQSFFEKMVALICDGHQTLNVPYETWMGAKGGYTALFGQGQLLYMYSNTEILPDLRDVTIDFGLLPLPKYDEAQDGYHVMSDTQVLIVPADVQNPEMVGVISEALAAESYKQVVPAVYEVTYENKYLRDPESYEIFNLIRDGLVYEFSWTYGEGNSMIYALPTLLKQKSTNIASFYAANAKAAEAKLAQVIDNVKAMYK